MSGRQAGSALECYELVARLTGEMRSAAQSENWELLSQLENSCREIFEQLIATEASSPQPQASQGSARKALLIRQILADDAIIRNLVEPRLTALERWLGGSRRHMQLRDAYGAGSLA